MSFNASQTTISAITGAISFKVPQSWLTANGLSPKNIVLEHHTSGSWQALPTTFVSGSDVAGEDYIIANTTSFSPFAIAGIVPPPPVTTPTTAPPGGGGGGGCGSGNPPEQPVNPQPNSNNGENGIIQAGPHDTIAVAETPTETGNTHDNFGFVIPVIQNIILPTIHEYQFC